MTTKSRVKLKKKPKQAIKELQRVAGSFAKGLSVKVGLPKGANAYPDGTSVIMVGAVHEFGSPKKNIPQRSYLRSTIQENRRIYKADVRKLTKRIANGDMTMETALGLLGLKIQTDVRAKITDIKTPPLRSRKGNPLIDTGHLRQSIVFEVG